MSDRVQPEKPAQSLDTVPVTGPAAAPAAGPVPVPEKGPARRETPNPELDMKLIEGPVVPTLISFSLPLLGTNLMHSFSASYGAAWAGQVVGPNALTAVVIANVLVWMMLMSVVMGIGNASSILIAQSYGARELDRLKAITGTSVTFVVVTALLLAVSGSSLVPFLLDMVATPPEARPYAEEFLTATCTTMVPVIFPLVFISVMVRGSGDARTPMVFTMLWLGLGLFFSPVLMIGAFGMPAFGLTGLVYGNAIAAALSLIAMLVHIYRSGHPLKLTREELGNLVPDPRMFRLLMMRGLPMGLEGILVSGVYLALLTMVNEYGAEAAAAYGAGTQLWGYIQMPLVALGASVAAMASQNIGANRWDRVDELAIKGIVVNLLMTGAGVAVVYLAGEFLVGLFLKDAPGAVRLALDMNFVVLWSWIPLAATMVLFGVVRANGAMMPPTLIMVGTLWLVRIPFAHFLQPVMGIDAIWWSFPAGTITCAALAYGYYLWGPWRQKNLMGDNT